MEKKNKIYFAVTAVLFVLFVIFTALVMKIDVSKIGPNGSSVGFATFNSFISQKIGVNMLWYNITEILGIVAILVAGCFGIFGLVQFIKNKSIKAVDKDIIMLGVFYVLVIAFYALFEKLIVNYRPVIMEGVLEASYPSSHTMLILCVMATAIIQFCIRINNKTLKVIANTVSTIIIAATIIGRIVSGVHWFTDIIGGILLSIALIMLYYSCISLTKRASM